MKKSKIFLTKKINFLLVAALLLLIPAFLSCNVSSGATPGGVEILQGDFSAPKLNAVELADSRHVILSFSKPVNARNVEVGTLTQALVDQNLFNQFEEPVSSTVSSREENTLLVSLEQNTQPGVPYGLRGEVSDKSGNTLSFASYFTGYNENVPKLVLSEIQTEYSKPKAEFVELYAQTSGNLAGVCIYSAYDGDAKRVELPAIDVNAGEYIVVHLRKVEETCVNETGSNLALSGGAYSSTARDIWMENASARLGKTDVILLEERAGGKIMDALCIAESKHAVWQKDSQAQAAKRAFDCGAWPDGSGIENALIADKVTATRTISRQGNLAAAKPCGKSGWIVTASKGATPGLPNSTTAYVEK